MNREDAAIADLENLLRCSGLKLTKQRVALLRAIMNSDDHPNAIELHIRSRDFEPTMALSTAYRTLATLAEQGIILRHEFVNMASRFELADRPHHDHLINVDTGEVFEFRSEKIERLQAEIAREMGIELVAHRLELYGRICSEKEEG